MICKSRTGQINSELLIECLVADPAQIIAEIANLYVSNNEAVHRWLETDTK